MTHTSNILQKYIRDDITVFSSHLKVRNYYENDKKNCCYGSLRSYDGYVNGWYECFGRIFILVVIGLLVYFFVLQYPKLNENPK